MSDSLHLMGRDLCLSGISAVGFESLAERLIAWQGRHARVAELLVWDSEGGVNRTTFAPGSSPADMAGVLEIDVRAVVRLLVLFDTEVAGVGTRVSVSASREGSGRLLEGQLFVDPILRAGIPPASVLDALVERIAWLAAKLDAELLVVADEDDDSLVIAANGLRLPSLAGVYRAGVLEGRLEALREARAEVATAGTPGYLVVRVFEALGGANDPVRDERMLKVLREVAIECLNGSSDDPERWTGGQE